MADLDKVETLKLVLIGEPRVGKTSIIAQYVDQVFQDDQQATIGGTFSSKKIKCSNGITLNLEIWDTAGQERFRSVTKMFYKDANAALLVYDITNKSTFEVMQSYWIEQVLESSPKDIILCIIANKSDLIQKEEVDEGEARQLAAKLNALFAVTSAKVYAEVNHVFLEIAKKYTGADSAITLEDKDKEEVEGEGFRKSRKESVKITKASQKKEKKGCC